MESARRISREALTIFAKPPLPASFTEVSLLLVLWSLFILNEGAVRYIYLINADGGLVRSLSDGTYGASPDLAIGFLFFAALFEITYGFMGLFLGLSCTLLGFRSTAVIRCLMGIQFALSLFVYLVYVIMIPILSAIHDRWYNRANLGGVSWFLSVVEIVLSSVLANALQGGQFMFMSRMVAIEEKSNFLRQCTGDRVRAMFWSISIAVSGFCTLITGIVLWIKFGALRTTAYFFSPNVGRFPALTTVTGLFMSLFGVTSSMLAAGYSKVAPMYFKVGAFVFLLTWINFTIAQLSFIGSGGGHVVMQTGQLFALFFLGMYFLWCAWKERSARLFH